LYLLRIQSNSGTNHSKLFHKMWFIKTIGNSMMVTIK
jgi:hypothetical protein